MIEETWKAKYENLKEYFEQQKKVEDMLNYAIESSLKEFTDAYFKGELPENIAQQLRTLGLIDSQKSWEEKKKILKDHYNKMKEKDLSERETGDNSGSNWLKEQKASSSSKLSEESIKKLQSIGVEYVEESQPKPKPKLSEESIKKLQSIGVEYIGESQPEEENNIKR